MTGFSWLHLTDLHRGMQEQNWLWPGVREIFFEDLKRLHDRCGPWDLVLFTGDLTQRGSAEEFRKIDDLLHQLWEQFDALDFSPKLLAVPGNHDLVRPDPTVPAALLLSEWAERPPIQDQFWNDPKSDYRRLVTKAFKNYSAWSEQQSFKLGTEHPGLMPGDFSATLEKDGARLGIVGLNTSFLQLTGDDYEGRLALHARQFHAACHGDGPEWVKQNHACLLLTHHPPAWLDAESRGHLRGEITAHGYFAAHLCGHMHDVVYQDISEGGTQARRTWQGRSLFGLEYFGETNQTQRMHGYTAGKIDLDPNKGQLCFWPREARLQGEQRRIVQDLSVELTDAQHTHPVSFGLLQSYNAPRNQSRRSSGPDSDNDDQRSRLQRAQTEFTNHVRRQIDRVLNRQRLRPLRESLLTSSGQGLSESARKVSPGDLLVPRHEQFNVEESIDRLHRTTESCLETLIDSSQRATVEEFKNEVVTVLGWLVLLAVSENWLEEQGEWPSRLLGAEQFEIPVTTEAGIEVVNARLTSSRATFELVNNYLVRGLNQVKTGDLEMGVELSDRLREMKKEIWKKVMRSDPPIPFAESHEEQLSTTLRVRYGRGESYYIILTGDRSESKADKVLLRELKQDLPHLCTFVFCTETGERVFVMNEWDLVVLIQEFLLMLRKYPRGY